MKLPHRFERPALIALIVAAVLVWVGIYLIVCDWLEEIPT